MNLKLVFPAKPLKVDPNVAIEKIKSIMGPQNVSTDEIDKVVYSKDYQLIGTRWNMEGKIGGEPLCIVFPDTIQQISELLKFANEHDIPVIPFGEGSGVVGGATPIYGGIIVDMKKFLKFEINKENLTVTVGVGMNGWTFERLLNEQGYTMGHVPQSIRASTVGGWIAHRAAGQFSTKYGKIEDMFMACQAVLPTGEIINSKVYPRASVGPMVDRLFLSSEGTLGIVTEATFKIWPYPEKRGLVAFAFPTMQDSLDAIRWTLQSQINPAVIRIYDIIETKRHFGKVKEAKNKLMVIFVCEGPARLVDLEVQILKEYCLKAKGVDCGEDPVHHWFETRFVVKESSEYSPWGLIFDTIEVACMWDVANQCYENTIAELNKVKGMVMSSAHASHFYTTGVCFYFTFAGVVMDGETPESFYNGAWDAAMRGVLSVRGTASHHHGMGISRGRWFEKEHEGDLAMQLKIKRALDPKGIMNPGKMFDKGGN